MDIKIGDYITIVETLYYRDGCRIQPYSTFKIFDVFPDFLFFNDKTNKKRSIPRNNYSYKIGKQYSSKLFKTLNKE